MYLTLIILSFATAAISMTVSKAKVSAPVRSWVASKSVWLGKMLDCPYCVSHWIALGLFLINPVPFNPFISIFAIIALATIIEGTMLRLLFVQENQIDDLKEALADAHDVIKELIEATEE